MKEKILRLLLGGVGFSVTLYSLQELNYIGRADLGLLFLASAIFMFVALFT